MLKIWNYELQILHCIVLNSRNPSYFMLEAGRQGDAIILRFLNDLVPLSNEIIELAQRETYQINIPKNALLTCIANEQEDCIFFVLKGLIRSFINDDNKDITVCITPENNLFGNIRNPGMVKQIYHEQFQALENTQLLAIPYEFIDRLYQTYPETNILARKLLAINFHVSQERSILSRIPSAESRYKQFQQSHPTFQKRVPLKYLASYLGMRIETLSRIRKKCKSYDIN